MAEKTASFGPEELAAAKKRLKIERLVLQIHNASFPADADEDMGRGTPYSHGAERLFEFAARLGFDAIQLGPSGMTDRGNNSPYDATIFSRNPLDLPLKQFFDEGRLSRTTWEALRRSVLPFQRGTARYTQVFDAYQQAIAEIAVQATTAERGAAQAFLQAHRAWLIPAALFNVLTHEYGGRPWRAWNGSEFGALDQQLFAPSPDQRDAAAKRLTSLQAEHAKKIEDYALIQWLLAKAADALRERLQQRKMALYADLQIGLSQQDIWAWRKVFLRTYRMGAPPSRTNREGQPWGYAVLDPDQFGTVQSPGPAREFVRARLHRLLAECDGVRIDHPHGWVDPWVYDAGDPDPLHAVQHGARLYSSPGDPQHPLLAKYAIARSEQLDMQQSLHADGHVSALDEEQVERYAILMDEILRHQKKIGRDGDSIACEVLSTLPYPLRRVLDRHGLGRFRVTQKLNLNDPADVYRIENAEQQDWIMLGTHDTPSIWRLADEWCQSGTANDWGRYLSGLLRPSAQQAKQITDSSGALINTLFTAILTSRARNVVVFFPDLFGMTERYNEPGVVSDANWSLRLPPDFEDFYARQLQAGRALDVIRCLQQAHDSP